MKFIECFKMRKKAWPCRYVEWKTAANIVDKRTFEENFRRELPKRTFDANESGMPNRTCIVVRRENRNLKKFWGKTLRILRRELSVYMFLRECCVAIGSYEAVIVIQKCAPRIIRIQQPWAAHTRADRCAHWQRHPDRAILIRRLCNPLHTKQEGN